MGRIVKYFYKTVRKIIRYFGISFSFSSDGEDFILEKLFLGIKNGRYIDIGSNHPVVHSNTFKFYLLNWQGICVVPLPNMKKKYKTLRPKDIFISAGLSFSKKKDLKYYYYSKNPDNSTFNKKRVEELKVVHNRIPSRTIKVDLIDVKYLIDIIETDKKFSEIHLLNLDVEGFEDKILESFFKNKLYPWVVCVEDLGFITQNISSSDINRIMIKNNYKLGMRTFLSSIYIHEKIIPILKSPFVKEWNIQL